MQLRRDLVRAVGDQETEPVARSKGSFDLSRRDLLVASVACAAGAITFLPTSARAEAQWQMSSPLPKAMEEIVGVALGKSMYVFGGYEAPGAAYRFDEETGRWATLRRMPERAQHLMATEYNGQIYVFGGFTFGPNEAWKPTAASYRYNPRDDSWTALAPLPRIRGAGQAVTVGNKIYVIGGVSSSLDGRTSAAIPLGSLAGQSVVGWVDEYDPATNTWRARATMPTPRNHFFAGEVDGVIYALEGRTGSVFVFGASSTDLVEAYDPAQDVWTLVGRAPTTRGGVTGVIFGGRIFVAGGESESPAGKTAYWAIEAYDPKKQTWAVLPHMRIARHGFAAAMIGKRFHVVGGSFQSDGMPGIDSLTASHEVLVLE